VSELPSSDSIEPSDETLDAFLATGDAALLDHVRTHTDPMHALARLLQPQVDAPSSVSSTAALPARPANPVTQLIQARFLANGLARSLSRSVTRASDLHRELTRDLDRNLHREHMRTRESARAGQLARDLDLDLDLVRDLDHVCELARIRTRDLTSELVGDLATELGVAHKLALGLTRSPTRTRAVFCTRKLTFSVPRARARARALVRQLMLEPVDASGMDLTALISGEADKKLVTEVMSVLAEVMWDGATRWPPQLREFAVSRSVEIGPGRYQVRSGTERDPCLRAFGQ
jgi:hypothetical protein